MNYLIERDRLLEVLTKLADIIDSRPDIPIMTNVFVDVSDAGDVQLGVDSRYLAEALDAMDGTQLAIVLQDTPDAPVLFEEVDGDGSLKMVVMPMRLPVAGTMPAEEAKKKAA